MRKTKRYIALLLLGAMLLSLLAGCASSDQGAPSEQPTQPPVETHYGENSVTAMSNYAITTASPDDEIMTAASSMIGQVDAVFTPTDNVVMAAAAAVSETLAKGGIPFYTGADSFVTAGAFATCGVNYTELGTYTADMALDILETGVVPAYHVMDGGIITVNTETAAALGIDYSAFNDLAGQIVEVTTAE